MISPYPIKRGGQNNNMLRDTPQDQVRNAVAKHLGSLTDQANLRVAEKAPRGHRGPRADVGWCGSHFFLGGGLTCLFLVWHLDCEKVINSYPPDFDVGKNIQTIGRLTQTLLQFSWRMMRHYMTLQICQHHDISRSYDGHVVVLGHDFHWTRHDPARSEAKRSHDRPWIFKGRGVEICAWETLSDGYFAS